MTRGPGATQRAGRTRQRRVLVVSMCRRLLPSALLARLANTFFHAAPPAVLAGEYAGEQSFFDGQFISSSH
jgi:hypothetical protein